MSEIHTFDAEQARARGSTWGVDVALVVQVDISLFHAIAARHAYFARRVRKAIRQQLEIAHVRFPGSLSINGPGGSMVVR